MEIKTLDFADCPAALQNYFAQNPSAQIFCIGSVEILSNEKIGFLCSSKSSGAAILKVFERANLWRKEQTTVIGGFHSPLKREVLGILLKGKGRIVICPARSIETFRLPKDWLTALTENRLLITRPSSARRAFRGRRRRNEIISSSKSPTE